MTDNFLKVATSEDFEELSVLVKELYDYTIYSSVVPFDKEVFQERFEASLVDPKETCTVLLRVGKESAGFISMSASPLLCSKETVAVELGFWIKPEYRNKATIKLLYKSLRTWAKVVGCRATLMAKIVSNRAPEQYVCRRIK